MAYRSNDYCKDEKDSVSGCDLSEKPTYLLDHLATFDVNKQSRIKYPADGMRKFFQLEKTTKLSSQKMQLCFDRPWVLITDYKTGVCRNKVWFKIELLEEFRSYSRT